jgi:hypothetical protein
MDAPMIGDQHLSENSAGYGQERNLRPRNVNVNLDSSVSVSVEARSAGRGGGAADGLVSLEFSPANKEEWLRRISADAASLGYPQLREGQADAVWEMLAHPRVMLVRPTGSGKTLCFQLAILAKAIKEKQIHFVLSPLRAIQAQQLGSFEKLNRLKVLSLADPTVVASLSAQLRSWKRDTSLVQSLVILMNPEQLPRVDQEKNFSASPKGSHHSRRSIAGGCTSSKCDNSACHPLL